MNKVEQLNSIESAPQLPDRLEVKEDSRFKSKFDKTEDPTSGDGGSVQTHTNENTTMDGRQVSIVVAQGEAERKTVVIKKGHSECKKKSATIGGGPYVYDE